jgi:hypothetical protein
MLHIINYKLNHWIIALCSLCLDSTWRTFALTESVLGFLPAAKFSQWTDPITDRMNWDWSHETSIGSCPLRSKEGYRRSRAWIIKCYITWMRKYRIRRWTFRESEGRGRE